MDSYQQSQMALYGPPTRYTSANTRKYYFIDSDGRRKGPVEAYKLLALGVTKNSYVWSKGMKNWERVFNVPDLHHMFVMPKDGPTWLEEGSTIWDAHEINSNPSVFVTTNIKVPKSVWQIAQPLVWSIGCFALAGLVTWLIIWAFGTFNDGKSHHVTVRVGVFILPFWLLWEGLKNLVRFFKQFFD